MTEVRNHFFKSSIRKNTAVCALSQARTSGQFDADQFLSQHLQLRQDQAKRNQHFLPEVHGRRDRQADHGNQQKKPAKHHAVVIARFPTTIAFNQG